MFARRLYAHRGASSERPENTIEAFERALELGADALEMDVHLTRDGRLVVAHDDTALRTTGVPTAWTDLDLDDVARLDAGWGFVAKDGSRPFAGKGVRVPLFDDVLAKFPGVPINVDIKGGSAPRVMDDRGRAHGASAVDAVLDVVHRAGADERVTIASFHLKTLVEVRRRGFAGQTGLSQGEIGSLLSLPALVWRQLPYTGNAAQVPTRHGPVRFDRPAFVAKCHSLGLRVDYWVVDDAAEAARLLELGADGIMTNDVAAIRPAFT